MSEDLEALSAELDRLRGEVVELESGEGAGQDLIVRGGDAESARRNLAAQKARIVRKRKQIEAVRGKMQKEVDRRKRELEAMVDQANEVMLPLKKMMAELEEGIWTVNLYLGTSEQIVTIREGKPAPAEEPIVIRQLVLAMDEETAINPESDGIDFREVEQGAFDDWLLEAEAHVDQVIPEQKCVVALVPRYESKDHDDPWLMREAKNRDAQTYFLIRNGENLYRIWTDFRVGKQLMPKRSEFTDLFMADERIPFSGGERRREPLRPGSREWAKAEERAERRERHYMRVALIFEGLIHRTTVWHPLPPEGVSFLDPAHHDAGRVRFVMDGEDDRLIGTGREPFRKWQARLNAQLRPGMRVILEEHGCHREGWNLSGGRGWHNPRIHPEGAEDPPSGVLLQIEEKNSDGELVVRYKRTREFYDPKMWVQASPEQQKRRPAHLRPEQWGHYGGYRLPKTRASVRIQPGDDWVLPFDLVTEEECITYLNARLDRHEYARMFPVLRSAIMAKRAEAAEEAPFVDLLTGVLARDNGVSIEEARAAVPEMIRWYKLTNKHHRALRKDEADAVRQITAEHARRLQDEKRGPDPKVVADLLEKHPDALLIGKKRSGEYGVLVPEDERPVYVAELEYGVKSGLRWEKRWRIPGTHYARWMVAHSTERWENWDRGASAQDHLTGPEQEALLKEARERVEGAFAITMGRPDYDDHSGEFLVWVCPALGFEVKGKGRRRKEDADARSSYEAQAEVFPWRRKGGEVELLSGYWGGKPVSRVPSLRKHSRLLWWDEKMAEKAAAAATEAEERSRERRDRSNQMGVWVGRFRDAWAAREEERAYAEFMREYGEPDLWEGHLKAHPIGEAPDWDALRGDITEKMDREGELYGALIEEVSPSAPEEARGVRFQAKPLPSCGYCGKERDDLDEKGYCPPCVEQYDPAGEDDGEEDWEGTTVCVSCGERKDDAEFEDGARCVTCAEQDGEALDGELVDDAEVIDADEAGVEVREIGAG